MSKDFDTTLSDAIDLAASAAHTSGAHAARLRGRQRTMRKRITLSTMALVLVAAGATAAIEASSTGGGTPQGTAVSPSVLTSTSLTATPPPTTSQPTVAMTTSPSSAGATTRTSSRWPACRGGDLRVWEGRGGAASGTDVIYVMFTNQSGHTCTVLGFPKVVVANASGVLLTAAPMLSGDIVNSPTGIPSTAAPVTLTQGAVATAMLTSAADNGETCYPASVGRLLVTAPGATRATSIGGPFTLGPDGACADFDISQFALGTSAGMPAY